jgi:site-specific DNA-cytosine methylase
MENVAGFAQRKFLHPRAAMLHAIDRLGYRYEWRLLNAADYGVPQRRIRFILIARRDGRPIRWPIRTHREDGPTCWVSAAEALGWGPTNPYPTIATARTTGGPDPEKVGGSGARKAPTAR